MVINCLVIRFHEIEHVTVFLPRANHVSSLRLGGCARKAIHWMLTGMVRRLVQTRKTGGYSFPDQVSRLLSRSSLPF
jgi:hypothetical protein